MTRGSQAMQRWSDLAAGRHSPETLAWVADVARAVMRASQAKAGNPRRTEMLKAVQLDGRLGDERDAIRALAESLAGDKPQMRQMVAFVLGLTDDTAEEAIDARVRRAVKD